MSQMKTKNSKFGEVILIYENKETIKCITLERGKVFNNKFGSFRHENIVGQPYGTKIYSEKSKGYITALRFLPYLWEKSISRLTQILFNPDISIILTLLNINKGSVIYESGTGSGCLSVNMAQNLESGHLYTFEFNSERAAKLKENFKRLNLDSKVTITHRDVVQKGFEVDIENLHKESDSKCDSIFIDLPSPWLIVDHAKKVLVPNGNFVSFSPCIEQIAETYKALLSKNFINLKTYECLYRNFNYTRTINVSCPELGVKRKAGEEIKFVDKELFTYNSKSDMKGHTGYLVVAISI